MGVGQNETMRGLQVLVHVVTYQGSILGTIFDPQPYGQKLHPKWVEHPSSRGPDAMTAFGFQAPRAKKKKAQEKAESSSDESSGDETGLVLRIWPAQCDNCSAVP